MFWLAARILADPLPPAGAPSAPTDVVAKITTAINFALYVSLAACAASAIYGAASFGWARKRMQFGAVNEGKAVLGWSLAGAALLSVILSLVNFAFTR